MKNSGISKTSKVWITQKRHLTEPSIFQRTKWEWKFLKNKYFVKVLVLYLNTPRPLPPSSYVNSRVRWLLMAVKNLFLFSIIWIGFRWCESRGSLNFIAFLVVFWMPPTRPFIDTLIFWYIKGVQMIHIWLKFHLCLICSPRVLKFQMFSYQQKVQFYVASGQYFGRNPLKCGKICLEFWPVMQYIAMHQVYDGMCFLFLKNTWN